MANDRFIDKTSDVDCAALRGLDPDLPDMLWRVITRYRPNLPADQWAGTREFVIATVLAMKPRTYENTRRMMSMTARFVAWTWTVSGCALTAEKVFTDAHARRYVANELRKRSKIYRWGVARQLSAISKTLTGSALPSQPFGPRHDRTAPYAYGELATMSSWANTLSTEHKRRNAAAILSLAGGAGLSAAEIMDARVEDIETLDGRLFVTVRGTAPRCTPVLTMWTRTLTRAIGKRTQGLVFTGYRYDEYPPRALQSFLTDNRCPVRPSASRLNCNFVVTLLNAHLPVQIIMEISGFTSATSLQPYLQFAEQPRVDDFLALIVGDEATR